MCVCCKGGAAAAPLYNIFSPPPLTCLATSPSQNVSCFNLVQTPPWWIACSINLDCFFKLFPSSPSPCVNKLSNPLISAGTRYHLTSLPPFPFFFFFALFTSNSSPRQVFTPSPRKLINLIQWWWTHGYNIRWLRSRSRYPCCTKWYMPLKQF